MSDIIIREATRLDFAKLHDADLKIFDDVWDLKSWKDRVTEDRIIYIASWGVIVVGFAACVILRDGIFIEKIGVKRKFRRQGVSRDLMLAAHHRAQTRKFPNIMSITIPETFLGHPGAPGDVTRWVEKVNFKAKPPLHKDYFYINGATIDGVPCLFEG